MKTSINRHILIIGILTLTIFGCGQSDTNTVSDQNETSNTVTDPNDTTKSNRNEISEKKHDFFSTDSIYNLNGISALDTFDLRKYIKVLGQPDSIRRGGREIIDEFGYDDYDLWYGNNLINAGHGYLLEADIKETGIAFNGIQVGNEQVKIETTFHIPHSDKDTITVINVNDDVLSFYLKNKIIHRITFFMPL